MAEMRIALAQINTTVGDLTGNSTKITEYISRAREMGADIVVFPEMTVCGYPPEDLLFKTHFLSENMQSLERIIAGAGDINVIVGFVHFVGDIYNAAAVINNSKLTGVYHKIFLPNYGVFDENRYFRAGNECPIYVINGVNVGVSICEDIWYEAGPPTAQALAGAQVLINISASPYYAGKGSYREKMIESRATDNVAVVALCNLVGGQDELVFDGNSMIYDEKGKLLARGKQFEEDLIVADIDTDSVYRERLHDPRWRKASTQTQWKIDKITITESQEERPRPSISSSFAEVLKPREEVYKALVIGTRDYINKNGFRKVVIGLSGGIDSSLVAAVAVDALGADNVVGVTMPSRFSSEGSITDSEKLARNLGIKLMAIPIEPIYQDFLKTLAEPFKGTQMNTAEENVQARIRGTLLMALSNKFGWLVLTTGNKSEIATGYTTLYGDMAGGFAVIKDVLKTMVYKLCDYRNKAAGKEIIPESIFKKEPSAELRPDQKDIDSLPPYEMLDPILVAYVEEDKSIDQIAAMGFPEDIIKRAAKLVDLSEYKRRQAPPGVKITPRAFGRDRRLPITNRFKEY